MKRSLEEQRKEYSQRKFLATPMAGAIVWTVIGLSGLFLPDTTTVWVLFLGTGSIIYIAIVISKFTGEHFLKKKKPKNEFDILFLHILFQTFLVYAIAIPFFLIDYTSLPMTVGILTGLIWFPLSWILKHWIGIFHSISRTTSILLAWYLFPEQRFIIIPFTIVLIYIVSIYFLNKRKTLSKEGVGKTSMANC